jgi:hypothetical protein
LADQTLKDHFIRDILSAGRLFIEEVYFELAEFSTSINFLKAGVFSTKLVNYTVVEASYNKVGIKGPLPE